jgi:hypothetical protein
MKRDIDGVQPRLATRRYHPLVETEGILMLRIAFLALLVLSSHHHHVVAAQNKPGQTITGRQWEVSDIRFQIPQGAKRIDAADAIDLPLSVTFKNEFGKQIEVPAFWNGDREFMVRFTPPKSGTWQYTTTSTLAELNNLKGVVVAKEAGPGRHGGIVVDSKSPRRFRFADGTSYRPIAFECDWLFALDAENEHDIPRTRQLVDRLAENGFNQVVMNVFAYDVNWEKDSDLKAEHEFGSPDVFPFEGTNDQPNHARLNAAYFQRLDRVIEYLDKKDIAAHLMIYVWNKRVNWPAPESEEDNRYFEYVVKRYQAYPHVVWDISKEALGYGHDDVDYISRRIERLRRLDVYQRLVTVHDYQYCRRFPDNVDFISVQLWGSDLYSVMRKTLEQFPGKPVLNIEHGGYEAGPYEVFTGNYTSAEVCLERAYQCVFAGAYATHYWQGAAWNVIVTDFETLEPEDRPRLDYYRHLRTLYDRYELDQLQAGKKNQQQWIWPPKWQRFLYLLCAERKYQHEPEISQIKIRANDDGDLV